MDRLTKMIKQRVRNRAGKISTLLRIKIGRGLIIYAALPLMSFWAFVPGIILAMPLSPSLWAKVKLNDLKERWRLR